MSAVQTFGKKKVSKMSIQKREDAQEEEEGNIKTEDNADLVPSSTIQIRSNISITYSHLSSTNIHTQ